MVWNKKQNNLLINWGKVKYLNIKRNLTRARIVLKNYQMLLIPMKMNFFTKYILRKSLKKLFIYLLICVELIATIL